MSIEQLKKMKLKDLIDIDASKLTSNEVAYIERRLIKEANRRLRRLKEARKLGASKITKKERKGFKSYTVPKGYKPSQKGSNRYVSANKKKKDIDLRNKRAKNVTEVQDFLKKKTTRLREISAQEERYRKVINEAVGKDVHLTDRQLKRVSRLMSKAQELWGIDPTTKKMAGSPRVLNLIIDLVKSRKYIKNNDIEVILITARDEGYEQAQRLLNDLNDEDNEGLDVYDDDIYY